jgi:hypothetical protein
MNVAALNPQVYLVFRTTSPFWCLSYQVSRRVTGLPGRRPPAFAALDMMVVQYSLLAWAALPVRYKDVLPGIPRILLHAVLIISPAELRVYDLPHVEGGDFDHDTADGEDLALVGRSVPSGFPACAGWMEPASLHSSIG